MAYFKPLVQILDTDALSKIRSNILQDIEKKIEGKEQRKLRLVDFIISEDDNEKRIGYNLLEFFWTSAIPMIFQKIKSHDPLLLLGFCTMRYQSEREDNSYIPWHLDGNFLGFAAPFMTFWIPFHEIGVVRPGLEFCLPDQPIDDAELADRWTHMRSDEPRRLFAKDDELSDLLGGRPFRREVPPADCGDVFAFDQFILHRTQILPEATEPRLAMEFRVMSRTQFPEDRSFSLYKQNAVSYRDPETGLVKFSTLEEVFGHLPEVAST